MTQLREPHRREWAVIDIYVGKKGNPGMSGLVSLKVPGKITMISEQVYRLRGLTPLHPQILRQAFWCNELDTEDFYLVSIHHDRVLDWIDLASSALDVQLRCYLMERTDESPTP